MNKSPDWCDMPCKVVQFKPVLYQPWINLMFQIKAAFRKPKLTVCHLQCLYKSIQPLKPFQFLLH